jgi:hypothetical protein
MKKMLRIFGAVTVIGFFASASALAGDAFAFSFGYNSGGYRNWHHHRHHRGYSMSFGYAYYPPPAYYYCPPPPPPPAVYYRYSPPVYYYSGGSFYCY